MSKFRFPWHLDHIWLQYLAAKLISTTSVPFYLSPASSKMNFTSDFIACPICALEYLYLTLRSDKDKKKEKTDILVATDDTLCVVMQVKVRYITPYMNA
jgi:hypothetical protein